MSFRDALNAFRENRGQHIDPGTNAALYNINIGLEQLTEALESEANAARLHRNSVDQKLRAIEQALQNTQRLVRR